MCRASAGLLDQRIHPRIRACPPYFSYYGRRERIYETEHLVGIPGPVPHVVAIFRAAFPAHRGRG
jgi:hypothetical protein